MYAIRSYYEYKIFKDNLNYWAGNYVVSSSQLDEFYGAMNDSISQLQSRLHERELEIIRQEDELAQRQNLVNETQEKLDQSQKLQNSITVLGMNINKGVYSVSMYLFVITSYSIHYTKLYDQLFLLCDIRSLMFIQVQPVKVSLVQFFQKTAGSTKIEAAPAVALVGIT